MKRQTAATAVEDTAARSLASWSEDGRGEMRAFYAFAQLDYELLAGVADWGSALGRVHERRGDRTTSHIEKVRAACHEVARPVVFAVGIIMIVYLPLLALRGTEGKMFRPMALTVVFALFASLVAALTLMPVLATMFLHRPHEHEPRVARWVRAVYERLLPPAMRRPGRLSLAAAGLFAASVLLAHAHRRVVMVLAWLAVFVTFVRTPLVVFATLVTQNGWGTSFDVRGITRFANPLAQSALDVATGSPEQLGWLIWGPHLLVMPAIYMLSLGGIGFAVTMFVTHPKTAEDV